MRPIPVRLRPVMSELVGDRVNLPASMLKELQPLMGEDPLTFTVNNGRKGRISCGVREFVAPEGTVQVSPWMWKSLNVETGDRLIVWFRRFKKLTYACFQVTPEIGKHPRIVEELAASLADYSTLTVGRSISIRFAGGDAVDITPTEVQPQEFIPNSGSIVNTDLEIDVVVPEHELAAATPVQGPTVSLVEPGRYRVDKGAALLRYGGVPSVSHFDLLLEVGETVVVMASGMAIAIDDDFELVKVESEPETADRTILAEGYERCATCRKGIRSSAMTMHAMQCARRVKWCAMCDCAYRTDLEHSHCGACAEVVTPNHHLVHRRYDCPNACDEKIVPREMTAHLVACQMSKVRCIYCDATWCRKDMRSHEAMCGSKSAECPLGCGARVTRKGLADHMAVCGL